LFGFDLIYLFIYVYFVFICSLARGFKRKRSLHDFFTTKGYLCREGQCLNFHISEIQP